MGRSERRVSNSTFRISPADLVAALAEAARTWQDPGYAPRSEAAEQTLEAPNRFTEEALAFSINQKMGLLQAEPLRAWGGERSAAVSRTVGAVSSADVPMSGLRDLLAVLLVGHRHRGLVPSSSPHLLPAFASDLQRRLPGLPVDFASDLEEMLAASEAVIANKKIEQACKRAGIPAGRRLLRGRRFSVGIIDGHEGADQREGLAEDLLLHEGRSAQSVRLVWAPEGLSPDPYLEAMAHFRAVFPVHSETPGALEMQRAFLEATDQSHAYGEGLAFLLSRGTPEVQPAGHVRWSEYDDLRDAVVWLKGHAGQVEAVIARPNLAIDLPAGLPRVAPGRAHRSPLEGRSPDADPIPFLARL